MKHHVNKIASACFYHIRRLRQIRHHVSREVMKQLVTSLVLSRLDYCNAILAGLPASTLYCHFNVHRMPPPVSCSVLTADPASQAALERTTVAGQGPHHLQSRNSEALHRRCPAYLAQLADLVAFSSTESHRQLRSTTTRAAAIQISNSDLVWKTGFLCLRSRRVEQSSSICPHRRLQHVLPPCSQNSSVPACV